MVFYPHGYPLKTYLSTILDDQSNLDFLTSKIREIVGKEYTMGQDVDSFLDEILNRPKIQEIMKGTYLKKEETEWIYQKMPLVNYVEMYIKSPYRSKSQIAQRIRDHVSRTLKRKNLDQSKREELIDEYLSSVAFRKFLSTPSAKKTTYSYGGMTLRKYIKTRIKNPEDLKYVYKRITSKIGSMYPKKNQELETVIHLVMESEEVKKLLEMEDIPRHEREEWLYKDGLLIDYLKTIDLNGKRIESVYSAVKNAILRKNSAGFSSIQEKKRVTEEFIDGEEFQNYLKFGYIEKCYFYSGMLLVDYLRLYYEETLEKVDKTVEDLYKEIIYIAFRNKNMEDLSQKEIEEEIGTTLRSSEISEYLIQPKLVFEDWSYHGEKLKDVILREYSSVIEKESDLDRIYLYITEKARKIKRQNKEMENETIIEFFLTKEFIENYVEEYSKRKKMRVEVEQKQSLYMNRNDFQYIVSYAIENGLEETEIVRMTHLGLNYYSAIIILEYAKKFNKDIDQIITFTLNIDKEENASLLWLIKLGYKDYISNLMEKNKYLIHYIIQDKKQIFRKNIAFLGVSFYKFLNSIITCIYKRLRHFCF